MFGAFIGAIVGIFFSLPGLLIGPIVGAVAGELIGGKRLVDAGRAGWGTLLGNLAALIGKLVIAFAMVGWFLVAAPEAVLRKVRLDSAGEFSRKRQSADASKESATGNH